MGKPGKEKDKWCWEFSWGGGAAADLEGCTHLEMGALRSAYYSSNRFAKENTK